MSELPENIKTEQRKVKTRKIIAIAIILLLSVGLAISIFFIVLNKNNAKDFFEYTGTKKIISGGINHDFSFDSFNNFDDQNADGLFTYVTIDVNGSLFCCDNSGFVNGTAISEIDGSNNANCCSLDSFISICNNKNKVAIYKLLGTLNKDKCFATIDYISEISTSKFYFLSDSLKEKRMIKKCNSSSIVFQFCSSSFLAWCYAELNSNVNMSINKISKSIVYKFHDQGHLVCAIDVKSQEDFDKCVEYQVDFAICSF